jgi:hypothetical protein
MHRAAMLCVAALVVGCGGGGSDALRVSLDDVDPSGFFWTIRATCTGGHLEVEFRPGEQLSVPGSATHRARRSPSNAGSPSASQSQTRSFVATRQQAQTWPKRPSSRRDSPVSPTVLLWSRPTRSGCRTPSAVAASASGAAATQSSQGRSRGRSCSRIRPRSCSGGGSSADRRSEFLRLLPARDALSFPLFPLISSARGNAALLARNQVVSPASALGGRKTTAGGVTGRRYQKNGLVHVASTRSPQTSGPRYRNLPRRLGIRARLRPAGSSSGCG